MMDALRQYIAKLEAQAELEDIKNRLNHVFQYVGLHNSKNEA